MVQKYNLANLHSVTRLLVYSVHNQLVSKSGTSYNVKWNICALKMKVCRV